MSAPKNRVVFLGAGRGVRSATLPPALTEVASRRAVLDWLLDAYSDLGGARLCFVGGFGADQVERRYPNLSFFFNPDWAATGPVASLSLLPLDARDAAFVSYTDVVYRRTLVARLAAARGDLAVAVDTHWRRRFALRGRDDLARANKLVVQGGRVVRAGKDLPVPDSTAEFAGVLRARGAGLRALREAVKEAGARPGADIPEVLTALLARGRRVTAVDVAGDWAELNAPQDLARFVLGTKAESLARLGPLLRSAVVDELTLLTRSEWESRRAACLSRVARAFGGRMVAVRSSSFDEDLWDSSGAGRYDSVLDVPSDDPSSVARAVRKVFGSYRGRAAGQQVLVQAMVRGAVMSGVVTTRTPSCGAPYYVFNFDEDGSATDGVTSGRSRTARQLHLLRGRRLPSGAPRALRGVYAAARELEGLVGHDSLDVEFATDAAGRTHVLQVRPLATRVQPRAYDTDVAAAAAGAAARFRALQAPVPGLSGGRTSFSSMADWNPAEIIGSRPGALALSLYRRLVTDETWARQRAEYGYRDVRPANLMLDFAGHPYVDVRTDLNSFLPAGLPERLSARLVEHSLDLLEARPALHDKVEFDVALTCLSADFERRAPELRRAGVRGGELRRLREALAGITRGALRGHAERLAAMAEDDARFARPEAGDAPALERAFRAFEGARSRVALDFAHLARDAFVATKVLRDLEAEGCFAPGELGRFMRCWKTVPSRMLRDGAAVAGGKAAFSVFAARYGHLRPGTYDVCSPRYADRPELFLRSFVGRAASREEPFRWSAASRARAGRRLSGLGLEFGPFMRFARSAAEGREQGKFVLSKYVSAGLESLVDFGRAAGLSRAQLSDLTYEELMSARSAAPGDAGRLLAEPARRGAARRAVARAVCLPPLLLRATDFVSVEQGPAEPNYVTARRARGGVAFLEDGASPRALAGKVVVVASADPGYDWIFGRRIAGLVTMYGGVNSHMAVRVAELGIPAAIGVGQALFERVSRARAVELDCAARMLTVLG